ncbi:MAG: GAF domain-containing protein [Spirochaetales bacterium]|nr:GAF domain-containing protein [Spirochaetales bacterium]MCF7937925.1 GAF domain-containing protein [Spirochaetales bacterium]
MEELIRILTSAEFSRILLAAAGLGLTASAWKRTAFAPLKAVALILLVLLSRDIALVYLPIRPLLPVSDALVLVIFSFWLNMHKRGRTWLLPLFGSLAATVFISLLWLRLLPIPAVRPEYTGRLAVLAAHALFSLALIITARRNDAHGDVVRPVVWALVVLPAAASAALLILPYHSPLAGRLALLLTYAAVIVLILRYYISDLSEKDERIAFFGESLEASYRFHELLGQAVSTNRSPEHLLASSNDLILNYCNATVSAVFLHDEQSGSYLPYSASSFVPGDATLLSKAAENREALLFTGPHDDPDFLRVSEESGLKSMVLVPILSENSVQGVLMAASSETELGRRDVYTLKAFSSYLSVLLDAVTNRGRRLEEYFAATRSDLLASIRNKSLSTTYPAVNGAEYRLLRDRNCEGFSEWFDAARAGRKNSGKKNERLMLILAGFSGEGVLPAIGGIAARALWRSAVGGGYEPHTILEWVYNGLNKSFSEKLKTELLVIAYNPEKTSFTAVARGKQVLWLYRNKEKKAILIRPSAESTKEVPLSAGDILACFSPGIKQTRQFQMNPGDAERKIAGFIGEYQFTTPSELADRLLKYIGREDGTKQPEERQSGNKDDRAVFVLKRGKE